MESKIIVGRDCEGDSHAASEKIKMFANLRGIELSTSIGEGGSTVVILGSEETKAQLLAFLRGCGFSADDEDD